MAIRVDDIVVTEKNVLLLSGGHQFVADIEKNTDVLDSGNFTRDRNPWNFYSSDGHLYHNLFDTENFEIRTQTLTGSTRHSPNNSRSHETIFMPHDTTYVGNCQFFDNSYTITDFTTSTLSSNVDVGDEESVYTCDHGFIRYDRLSSYDNPSEYYISPSILFNPKSGVQYITEYPVNGYYMDFGDNETKDKPTVFGDSVLCKYYLDQNYSVSSYDIDSEKTRFRQLRTYYDIGSTGNSIYMVFRNNLNGVATLTENSDEDLDYISPMTYSTGMFPVSSIGYMSNIVTMIDTVNSHPTKGFYYASDPYSDMFSYVQMASVSSNCVYIKQPSDNSFILYIKTNSYSSPSSITLTYIPKIGLERSSYTLTINEDYRKIDIVELPHCVAIGTQKNGIVTVWSRDYLYDGGDTLVNFNPFQHACSGKPSSESLTSTLDGNIYRNIKLFYNGSDILGAKATVSNELSAYGAKVAFFSTNFSDEERDYELGQFFMPAGNPLYEIDTLTSDTPIITKTLSSVPVSSRNESTGSITWNFEMRQVDVVTGMTSVTSDPFQVSANYVYDSDILFDYSSTVVENELDIGSYAFVQFEKYGLAKCYVGDIYSDDGMVKFSSTGPVNRYDSRAKIWNRLANTTDAYSKIKGKANTFDDLKRIPSPTNGDIYSVVDEHSEDGWSSGEYAYFSYETDGNTSSWVETSVSYVNGICNTFNDICALTDVKIGDTYLLKGTASYSAINAPVYSFYRYTVNGNLSSWNYVGDNGTINGRKAKISQFPGYTSTIPSEGEVYLLTASDTRNGFSTPSCCFYIYDVESLKGGATYIKKWQPIDLSPFINSDEQSGRTFIGTMTFNRMMSDTSIRFTGKYGVLVDDGSYGGITFSKGGFYYYDANATMTNGWVYCTNTIGFSSNSEVSAGYSFNLATYDGFYDTYEQLTHISPPKGVSIYLVIQNNTVEPVTYPAYTYFRYGYNDNQLDWWKYDISEKATRTVDDYTDLWFLRNVENEELALVKNTYTRSASSIATNNFLSYNEFGNSSIWEYSSSIGKVKGNVVNWVNLFTKTNVSVGDIYVVQNAEGYKDGYDKPQHYFYKFDHTNNTNTASWTPVDLTTSPYNLKLSGYADSYQQIENLSGVVGSMYFTESYDEPSVFYKLENNANIKYCTDATFSVLSYGDDSKKPILDAIDFIASDYSTNYITGKPALKSIFKSSNGLKYTNSFSAFPLDERDVVKEPLFSTTKSSPIEITPNNVFTYALDKPIENSMGVSIRTFKDESVNHDSAISLVKWNNPNGEFNTSTQNPSPSGLHLQYNGICTDVYMNGTTLSSVDEITGNIRSYYSSTIYEYPHPCYGELKTAGTGLPIFDGPLGESMKMDDMFFVNGYFVVKNYSVAVSAGKTDDEWNAINDNILGSGKHQKYDTGKYPVGGYVVTNFFADTGDGSGIPYLYESKLIESSKETPKTKADSERFYDYNYLWHITPSKPIEFYPESVAGKTWTPYYPSKYVDFIKYHNGYYYISLRSKDVHDSTTVGYDIIETDTLFTEKKIVSLKDNLIVSGIRFFDSHVAVEYKKLNGERFIKWFESGKSHYKVLPVLYSEDISTEDGDIRKSELETKEDYSSNVVASYDNVEVMNSLNRFTPIVNHKSNLFSIRIEDLGFEESEYLTDYQKKVLRTYFRNSISDLVNSVKPAHTQLFDVYLG